MKPEKIYIFDHLAPSKYGGEVVKLNQVNDDALAILVRSAHKSTLAMIQANDAEHAYGAATILYLMVREQERRELIDETMQMLHTLKAAGYPQNGTGDYLEVEGFDPDSLPPGQPPPVGPYWPPLMEVIKTLGDKFGVLERFHNGRFGAYYPNDIGISATGATPFLALCKLWLLVKDMGEEHEARQLERDRNLAIADSARVHNALLDAVTFPGCKYHTCHNPQTCQNAQVCVNPQTKLLGGEMNPTPTQPLNQPEIITNADPGNVPVCNVNPVCLQPPVCTLAGQCEGQAPPPETKEEAA